MKRKYTKTFQKMVIKPLQKALELTDGEVTDDVRRLFRDACLKVGHIERVRNLYRVRGKLSGQAEWFVPNEPQEEFLEKRPQRSVILKTRQVGFTTLSCIRALDLALWEANMTTGVMAHLQNLVVSIFTDIVKFSYNHFVNDWGTFYSPNTRGDSRTELAFSDDGLGRQLNSSMLVKFDFRGKTIRFLHVSEAAFVAEERLIGSLQAVPATGEVVLESTPNGRGGLFYQAWQDWKTAGKQAPYTGIFVPWWRFYPERPEDSKWDLDEEKPLDPYERELIERGLSERQVAWRRWCILANCGGDAEKFAAEYPNDDISCWLSGRNQVFPATLLLSLEKHVRPPAKKGFLLRDGARLALYPDENGTVEIWEEPGEGKSYVIGADPSGGTGGDRAVAYVKCRESKQYVAKLSGQIEPADFADALVKLGTYYHKAWICIEVNNHGHAVVQSVKEKGYANLYKRKTLDELTGKPTKKVGFLTSSPEKLRITENLKTACREGRTIVLDSMLISEMSTFVQIASKTGSSFRRTADGSSHDDCVMAAAFTEEMDNSMPLISAYNEREMDIDVDPETGFPI